MELSHSRRTVSCVVAAVGAAIVTGGTFFELAQVTFRVDAQHSVAVHGSYLSTNRGRLVAAIGVVVFAVALAELLRRADGVLFAFVAGLGGIAVIAVSTYDRIDVNEFVDDRAHASVGPALAACIGGGVIVLLGVLVAVSYWPRAARRARRQTSP